jgi:hypothetical protein
MDQLRLLGSPCVRIGCLKLRDERREKGEVGIQASRGLCCVRVWNEKVRCSYETTAEGAERNQSGAVSFEGLNFPKTVSASVTFFALL